MQLQQTRTLDVVKVCTAEYLNIISWFFFWPKPRLLHTVTTELHMKHLSHSFFYMPHQFLLNAIFLRIFPLQLKINCKEKQKTLNLKFSPSMGWSSVSIQWQLGQKDYINTFCWFETKRQVFTVALLTTTVWGYHPRPLHNGTASMQMQLEVRLDCCWQHSVLCLLLTLLDIPDK